MDLEISVPVNAIVRLRLKDTQREYPVPPPLSGAAGNEELVCEVLQSLWEEEYSRTKPGERFCYTPEGVADGIDRPDCSETPWIQRKGKKLSDFVSALNQQESTADVAATATSSIPTQQLMDALGDLGSFDMSIGDVDSHQELTATVLVTTREQTASTFKQTFTQNADAPIADPTVKQMSQPDVPAPPAAIPPGPIHSLLPNGRCVLKYASAPPLPASSESSQMSLDPRISLTGATQLVTGPQRAGKPVPVPEDVGSDTLTFGTLAVLELLSDDDKSIIAVSAILVDERSSVNRHVVFCIDEGDDRILSPDVELRRSASELLLLHDIKSIVFDRFDPLAVLSWDCSTRTFGHLIERGCLLVGENKKFSLSRNLTGETGGRLLVDLWRVLRNDAESGLRLGTTSLEGVVHSVLGMTVPSMNDRVLASAWKNTKKRTLVLQKLVKKCMLVHELADVTRVMPRATEMARLYGMDLESTFTRGSQFRVECMLVRATRRLGYVLPSSSKHQVKHQSATEGIPMVLEPVSGFITDPVCVFDFQSLYPSLVIGYNMCFSTCLGRVTDMRNVVQLGTQPGLVRRADDLKSAVVTSSDVAFVERAKRVGILPRICHEILQTRIMVKRSMKGKSPALLKQLDARQLSLKLLANVIYGYTTASFSGRMPCAEIADSIVLTGRESLEAVMRVAESMGGVIVYGDTDSLFVRLPNKSVAEAFAFGKELVDVVAATHPWPMKLVHEKVYYPCCLVTKKRYVGRAFDTLNSEPRLDAKGIETIRRDTCPAVAAAVERIINHMFDMSENSPPEEAVAKLEAACIKEFTRMLRGAMPRKFFVFQNKVRDLTQYKDANHLPPAARVAVDSGRTDTMGGERVAFVITLGPLGSKLSEQVKQPSSLLAGSETLNYEYYVTKQVIPAVQRIFGPLANRAFTWLSVARAKAGPPPQSLDQQCLLCGSTTASSIFKGNNKVPLFCVQCSANRQSQAVAKGYMQMSKAEQRVVELRKACCQCAGCPEAADMCTDSYHCEVYFQRDLAKEQLNRSYKDLQRMGFKSQF